MNKIQPYHNSPEFQLYKFQIKCELCKETFTSEGSKDKFCNYCKFKIKQSTKEEKRKKKP